ncbi:MAG: SPOR domain-containing protein [Pseudomonadota bacterium]|nr:SPOR domain-containing protein [Pseudomonadota bacterium]
MSRDGKRSSRADTGGTPPWVWMLTGFVLGIVLSLAVYLKGGGRMEPGVGTERVSTDGETDGADGRESWVSSLLGMFRNPGSPATERMEPGSTDRDRDTSAGKQRDFEFYTLLPDLEVAIPDESERPARRDPGKLHQTEVDSRVAPSPDAAGRYMLQAGSFQKFSQADSLRARLALIGVEASIQDVEVGKTIFHRVRVGPYREYSDAAQIQEILKRNKVESLLMKSGG